MGKPHGLQGEMRVILLEDAFEEVLEVSEFCVCQGPAVQHPKCPASGRLSLATGRCE
ncbi:MAG: hypothetical protein IPJ06_10740 [Saprospiraceae bacterium]|nr:hypothetical protein [Saprospiraceae bacterium]